MLLGGEDGQTLMTKSEGLYFRPLAGAMGPPGPVITWPEANRLERRRR